MRALNILTLLLLLTIVPCLSFGQALDYNNNRIAISADGNIQPDLEYTGKYNTADPDDWGAMPATLIMIAKKQLQNKLVHLSFNNFMPSPPHTTVKNYMKDATDQAMERLKFNEEVFFDVGTHKQEAILSLKNEIIKSTATDPLYYVHMGPAEFFYQVVKAVVDEGGNLQSLSHVYVISHSGYNDNHLRRDTHHTMKEAIALSGNRLKYTKIKDQNNCDVGYLGWCSKKKPFPWKDIRDHHDPHIQWLWERMQDHKHGKFDISDAGMMYYLLTGDEDGSPSKFTEFLGYGIMLPDDIVAESINIKEEKINISPNKAYQLKFGFKPSKPWDDYYTWETSNGSVAYVSPNGRIIGVGPGKAIITIKAGIGNLKDSVEVIVLGASARDCDIEEKDGFLVLEAERFKLKGAWSIKEDNVASSGKYIQYTGPNSYNNAKPEDEISYTFRISTAGTYNIRWFMRQPDEAEGDKSNDAWVKMEGNVGLFGVHPFKEYTKFVGRSKTIFGMNGKLEAHHKFAGFSCNFSEAGEYTIRIAGRSELLQIDKLVFYRNDISDENAIYRASEITETTSCFDDLVSLK
ncbi:Ig-like domain-containing protein [Seonamhaeicola maritimus]|uniref:Ig-like domain-containing protein n=1 Tax=Seonamhaeicola maritimus TaxID=2591822 RepID=UPI002495612A|nr:Ig-like domain-containing protein [Seonamhaeicola maritimus]